MIMNAESSYPCGEAKIGPPDTAFSNPLRKKHLPKVLKDTWEDACGMKAPGL